MAGASMPIPWTAVYLCNRFSKTTKQNKQLLETYGAELSIVDEPDPATGEYLTARLNRVQELLAQYPGAFWTNQYANLNNAIAHQRTMRELMSSLDDQLDFLFCSISTCGTLKGCAEFLRGNGYSTKIIAVDAVGSVIFGGLPAKRLIPGHGAAVCPELFEKNLADCCVHVSDFECIVGCRRLLQRESLLVGGSSGATLMAVERVRHEIPDKARCAVIFPDRGEIS